MKCPKCGFDNPEETLFCKNCDWRTDIPYVPERKPNALVYCAAALAIGLVAIVLAFTVKGYGAIAAGAVGLVAGGYAVNVPRLLNSPNKGLMTVIAGIGLMLSMIAFMLGLYDAVM
jgi:hypothetical protein